MNLLSERVFLRKPVSGDQSAIRRAYANSTELHHPWTSAPANIQHYMSQPHRYLVCRRDSRQIAGTFNISEIVRGRLQSAYLGYEAFSPHERQGFMLEGMHLLLEIAFTELRLHRLEANIQPGNEPSKALAAKSGFSKEGFSSQYLKVGGEWKDHERWAILNSSWVD